MSAWKAPWQRSGTSGDGDASWMAAVRADLGRRQHGAHLDDETWLALARGVPPPDGVDALSHVARCADCREVLRAVRELAAAAPEALDSRARTGRRFDWRPLLAAAAVLVVLGAGWLAFRPVPPTVATSARSTPPSPVSPSGTSAAPETVASSPTTVRPDWLRATPPAIALFSPGAVTMRGEGQSSFPDDLAEALAPWRAGRYAEAAGRLGALRRTYPDAVELPYYQGVAWLLSGSPQKAVAPLRQALDAAPPSLRAGAAWYLGVSLLDSAQPDTAHRAFTEACRAGHARGCDAARLIAAVPEGS